VLREASIFLPSRPVTVTSRLVLFVALLFSFGGAEARAPSGCGAVHDNVFFSHLVLRVKSQVFFDLGSYARYRTYVRLTESVSPVGGVCCTARDVPQRRGLSGTSQPSCVPGRSRSTRCTSESCRALGKGAQVELLRVEVQAGAQGCRGVLKDV
jgi:hypothetical protein